MIIAVSNTGRDISPHFGHSDGCTIYHINNSQITEVNYIANPAKKQQVDLFHVHEGNHKSGSCSCRFFAEFILNKIQIDVIVTVHMGGKAYQLFNQCGTNVISGIKGKIDDYLQDYLGKAG
ncbi:NifB/NifX family molybdenum-iron cluster-binding protein [Desulfosporosinus hippei]|uniref:Predicted Fe-Mo cluster-binding protein, NifX family n=1 Tax=Desulfosporosinus hippei DSM 8344 TaxID=1121419 RepID=A0A1G8KD34_9FIRM|nr:NifB/NifX family molybdenum-iron cluster-binding protein [Desulfosporosinus hippei]SDI41324.1 Predicted Fe-Mo cluster-binding protein, NifX family [Desulfosporosinus hippei DSM 8344]